MLQQVSLSLSGSASTAGGFWPILPRCSRSVCGPRIQHGVSVIDWESSRKRNAAGRSFRPHSFFGIILSHGLKARGARESNS